MNLSEELSPAGTLFHGVALDTDEAMSLISESMITIQWLKSIHPNLPKHIKEKHSHLFTREKPNWADLQPDFVKIMESLITEVTNREEDDTDPTIRWLGTPRGGRRGRGSSVATRGPSTSRNSGRSIQSTNRPLQGRFCDICHAAGKPENIVKSHNMPWCKALSNHGKKSLVSSIRLAFVEDDSPEDEDDSTEEQVHNNSQDI